MILIRFVLYYVAIKAHFPILGFDLGLRRGVSGVFEES